MEREWIDAFMPKNFGSSEDAKNCELMRDAFVELAKQTEKLLPEGRYKALVKTKLEEAAMFATKSFTHRSRD